MNRKIFVSTLMLLLLAGVKVMGETTLRLPDISVDTGTSFDIELTVEDFNNIAVFEFYLEYDAALLSFDTVSGINPTPVVNDINGNLLMSWYNTTPLNLADDDVLMTLSFNALNPGISAISFTGNSFVADENGQVLAPVWSDGSVTIEAAPVQPQLIFPELDNINTGDDFEVDITVTNFEEIAILELIITYDQNLMTFISVSGVTPDPVVNNSNGQISLSWFNTTPLSLPENSVLMTLHFQADNPGFSALEFAENSFTADENGNILNANFFDGSVEIVLPPPEPLFMLPELEGYSVGETIEVDLTVVDFRDIAVLEIFVEYDAAILLFESVSGLAPDPVCHAQNNLLSLSWFATTPLSIVDNDLLLSFNFAALSSGTSALIFTENSFATDSSGNYLNLSFVNGSVSISNSPPEDFDLIAPLENSSIVDLPCTFEWSAASDPDPEDVINYTLELATDESFNNSDLIEAGQNLSVVANNLEDDTGYWWRVLATDLSENIAYSTQTWYFETEFPQLPSDFSLLDPLEGDTLQFETEYVYQFIWSRSFDPDPGSDLFYRSSFHALVEDENGQVFIDTTLICTELSDTTLFYNIPDSLGLETWQSFPEIEWQVQAISSGDTVDCETAVTFWLEPDTEVEEIHSDLLPSNFAIENIYPNPFNPTVNIRLSIPESGRVEICIYDILGRHISTIANTKLNRGYHQFSWTANVPSGVYFLHARNTKGWNSINRIIFMK